MRGKTWMRSSSFRSDNRKSKTCTEPSRSIQNRKWVGILAIAVAFGGVEAEAEQAKKLPRIVYLSVSSPLPDNARYEAFRQGLREMGYVEGKNILVEWR